MCLYINSVDGKYLPPQGKAQWLIDNVEGTEKLTHPILWQDDLVCVVENFLFDAAVYADTPEEMAALADTSRGDYRKRTWLVVPGASKFAK